VAGGAGRDGDTVEFGAHVTGVTLSSEQLGFCASAHADVWAWPSSADLRLQDYRDIHDAPFDAICSIEMVEAVGREYWPTYFATVSQTAEAGRPGLRAKHRRLMMRCLSATWPRPTSSSNTSSPVVACPAQASSAARLKLAGLEVVEELAFGPRLRRDA